MSKVPKNSLTKVNESEVKSLSSMTEDLLFIPNPRHRQVKAKFWARYDSLMVSPDKITAAAAIDLTSETTIARWWSLPGFKDWFLNQDEARERLEYLYMLALDTAEQVLANPDSNDNAKVQMVKVIAQLAGKEPKAQVFADDDINKMDAEKLKAYIEKVAPRLLSAPAKVEEEK